MYCVYLIKSENLTYVGMTNDFLHRIRQHNGEIKGGAKYTSRKKNWYPILIIDGFTDKKSACQCEWKMKHLGKRLKGNGKIINLSKYLSDINNKWTSNCEKKIYEQNLKFYIDNYYNDLFNKSIHDYTSKELYFKI